MPLQILDADDARIAEIEVWLDAEEAAYDEALRRWEEKRYESDVPARGFRCNWDSAKRWWREGHTKMFILVADNEAVGFLVGTDILEIKPNRRGMGYGRVLAEHLVKNARDEGRSVIEIEIAPSSAKPFWQRMGFTLMENRPSNGGGTFAYKILPKTFALSGGERVAYAISYFTQSEAYSEKPKPFARFVGLGERLSDGGIQLPERAFCFNPQDNQHVDYFVKIEIQGGVVHFNKAKYQESNAFGVERDAGHGFFIERISAKSAPAETM